MNTVKISAVIITLNEEDNIARCLESIKNIVDEIVIVDSFSTDKTEEIAARYRVKFIKHKFEGYVEQIIFATGQASNDYILSIDGDEALSETLQQSVLEVKKNWTHDAYSFNRLNNYCGTWIKHGVWYPDIKTRLWDRRKGNWGGENPHYKVTLNPGSKSKHIKGDLLHYTYKKPFDQYLQMNRFSEIASKVEFTKGKKTVPLFHLWLYPIFVFIKSYIIKLGMLDGYYGWILSKNEAYFRYMKYMKLKFLWDEHRKATKNKAG
ncbi:MAG TPA: glycosyltransferase family 2 protein [Cyclobacteriaceae bacterium]|nr:glycosyltransferase family 2 protein [Cyclobacteriaceae bacterium]